MYPINEFKYAILLTTLEKIKGTKGPIDKFIKKIFSETDSLSTRDPESMRYAFMTITRAINYSKAMNPCSSKIRSRLDTVAEFLTQQVVIAENVLQTFEFWSSNLTFRPLNLADLKRVHDILVVMKETQKLNYNIYDWNIFEIKHLEQTKRNFALRMFITKTIGSDSPILKSLSPIPMSFDPTTLISSFEEIVNNLEIILKETYEYVSRSSTTDE